MASPEFLTQKGLPNPPRRKIRGAGVQESDNSTSCHIDLEKEEESGGGEGSSELEAGRERGREGKKKDADGGKHSGGGGGGEFPKTEEKWRNFKRGSRCLRRNSPLRFIICFFSLFFEI